jgi:hypothetical protein
MYGTTINRAYGFVIEPLKRTGINNAYGIMQKGLSDINYLAGKTRIGYEFDSGIAENDFMLDINGSLKVSGIENKGNFNQRKTDGLETINNNMLVGNKLRYATEWTGSETGAISGGNLFTYYYDNNGDYAGLAYSFTRESGEFEVGDKLKAKKVILKNTPLDVTPTNGMLEFDGANLHFVSGGVRNKIASNIGLEQLDQGIIFNKTLATTQVINSATPVDLTALICGGVTPLNEGSPFYYDSANNLIRCSNLTQKYFSINIILLLSGTITSGGSGDTFLVTLHRPNDAIFRSFLYNSELTTETFTSKQVSVINSYVQSGGNDNFQLPVGATAGGFRIKISRVNGNTIMTLDTTNIQSIRLLT